jgi:DNA-binding winged helix-turn-helix (wHTH) protein/Flp pilus assembly protein TadD
MEMRRLGQAYVFGDFRLDTARRALSARGNGRAIPLSIPVFDTLLYLIENAGELVERTALLAAVWPHVTVVENSVNQTVSALRRALGDDPASPCYVLTVPGRGYRFIAEVTAGDSVTRNPEAYQYYVAGWSALTRPGGENLEDALDYLERAVACDPEFGLAHACIADCYTMLCVHGLRPADEAIPKAHLAAQRAMEADPDLPEAYVACANLQEIAEQDFAAALERLAHAIALDPLCFSAQRYLGLHLINCGKFDEALAALRKAQAIQPLALYVSGNIGMALYFSGRYEEAITQFELTLRTDPEFEVARVFLGRSLLRLGQLERAIAEFERATKGTLGRASDLAVAWAVAGRPDAARSEFIALLKNAKIQPFDMANIHAALGEDEEALTWLERAVEARSFGFFPVDPVFRHLRNQPRFIALVDRLRIRA